MKLSDEDKIKEELLYVFEDKNEKLHKRVSKSYARDFNHIDHFNRYMSTIAKKTSLIYYRCLEEVKYKHRYNTWQVCFIWEMINAATVNSWTLWQTVQKTEISLPQFYRELSIELSAS